MGRRAHVLAEAGRVRPDVEGHLDDPAAVRRTLHRGEDRGHTERHAVHDAGVDRLQHLDASIRGHAHREHEYDPHRRGRHLRRAGEAVRTEGGLRDGRPDLAPAHGHPAHVGRDACGELPERRVRAGMERRRDQLHAPREVAVPASARVRDPSARGSRVMSFMESAALAMVLAAGLSQPVALSQSSVPPTESSLSRNPALVHDWSHRLLARDPKVRTTAEAALVQGARRSFPLLRRFVDPEHEDLHAVTFQIIQRIGPPAIPLLVDLLRHESDSIRRSAVNELIDLAPYTALIQPALRRALRDEDANVAGDAARALGALGQRAGPSVGALVTTLSHEDPYVRIYAAEALASIGPGAARATSALAHALDDPVPGVRWAACEALGSIGPAAQSAVPQLIDALGDEFLYVRIFAAGALGSIGPKAESARDALKAAADDPALHDDAAWALCRIGGVKYAEGVASHVVPAPSVAPPLQTTLLQSGNPPVDWDTTTGRNIVWSVELGHETFGRPVVAGDAVYVGTDNSRHLNPEYQEDAGVLMAFRAKDGAFLWQDVAPRVERGLREWLLPSTTSTPHVEGRRLYYVTAECQLRSLDTQRGDIVWELDMCGRLGVFPHEATNSEVLPVGDLL